LTSLRFLTIICFLSFSIKSFGQSQKELFFYDSKTIKAVENVYILSKTGEFLDISNQNGRAEISDSYDSIQVKRLGYKDTVFEVPKPSNRLGLKIETNLLNEVVLKNRRKDPFELLKSAHDNGWDWYKESMKYAKNYRYNSTVDAGSFGSRILDIPVMAIVHFSNRNFFPLPRELACDTVILNSNLDSLAWLHPLQIFPFFWLDDVIGYKHLYFPFKEGAEIAALGYSQNGKLEISMTYTDSVYTLAKYQGKVVIDTASNLILSLEAYADELDCPVEKSLSRFDSIKTLGLSGSHYHISFNNDPFNYYIKGAQVFFKHRYYLESTQDSVLFDGAAQLYRLYSDPCENIYAKRLNLLAPLIIYKDGWTGLR